MLIGLMGAMPEEIEKIINSIQDKKETQNGNRVYHTGKLFGHNIVAVFSRWGKVAAATTATDLIVNFKVDKIIFTGVAGAISDDLNIGDVVIAERLFQHDMDARPLMKQFEIPLMNTTFFEIKKQENLKILNAANNFIANNSDFKNKLSKSNINMPKVVVGDVASGDVFVADTAVKQNIQKKLPSVLCVEMEGAAVAQVCNDFETPLNIVRVISDTATEKASSHAMDFLNKYASDYSLGIIKEYIQSL